MTGSPVTDDDLFDDAAGWGDGSYPAWVGRTASGEVACFIADMLLFDSAVPDLGTNPAASQ